MAKFLLNNRLVHPLWKIRDSSLYAVCYPAILWGYRVNYTQMWVMNSHHKRHNNNRGSILIADRDLFSAERFRELWFTPIGRKKNPTNSRKTVNHRSNKQYYLALLYIRFCWWTSGPICTRAHSIMNVVSSSTKQKLLKAQHQCQP